MGRPFHEMLLLCAGQAVRDFITDMSPDARDDQMQNDLITGYSDLQGLGSKQAAYDNITQRPDKPLRSYIIRYSRLFKLLNGTVPNDVKMRTKSIQFVNSLCSYLSSKVENRLLGMNERNYSPGDTFKVTGMCAQGNSLREVTCETQGCIDESGGSRPASGTAAVQRVVKCTCATQIIKVRIMTQTFRKSTRKQHTQLLMRAKSHNNHLQQLTYIKLLTTNQIPHIAPATTTHL